MIGKKRSSVKTEPVNKRGSVKTILQRIETKIDDLIAKDKEVHKKLEEPKEELETVTDVKRLRDLYPEIEDEMGTYEVEHEYAKGEGYTYSKELYDKAFPNHK